MRPQPLLCTTDVEATSRWYQHLLGLRSDHGGPNYERLVRPDGTLALQLHHWAVDHHHGPIGNPELPVGNGVLVWLELDLPEFHAAVARAGELKAPVVLPLYINPPDRSGGPNHFELWIRDPNGYTIVLASPDDSAGPAPAGTT